MQSEQVVRVEASLELAESGVVGFAVGGSPDPADAVPGFERLIRHWDRSGDDTHQWTTLRNLVELLTRLGAHMSAARLLGAVSTAARPTFGAEGRRLEQARDTMRAHLGEEADVLIQAGRDDDLAAAVELGLTTLRQLQDAHRSRAGS